MPVDHQQRQPVGGGALGERHTQHHPDQQQPGVEVQQALPDRSGDIGRRTGGSRVRGPGAADAGAQSRHRDGEHPGHQEQHARQVPGHREAGRRTGHP
ncbi:hypothetical protein, partial [Streptomyces sp. M3]|uniref:hypothetical protein n=1 Tax=Streptomyces sp. M3 TaxID=295102 RepID=UPI001F50C37F